MHQPKGREPGVYLNLDMQDYHNDPAIGGGAIKDILISDEAYWYGSVLNSAREQFDTNAYKVGRAYHAMVLEPTKAFPFKIKAGVQSSKVEGMIGEGDYNKLLRAYFRLLRQPKHWNSLHGGFAEVSIFFRDPETQLMCKIRPDNFSPEYVGDLKFLAGVSDNDLFFNFTKFGYHISGYRYSWGMQCLKQMIRDGYQMPPEFDADFIDRFMNREKQLFCFTMQEKEDPFSTRLWTMTPWAAELGASFFKPAMGRLKDFYENPKYWAKQENLADPRDTIPLAYPDTEELTDGMIWVPKKF